MDANKSTLRDLGDHLKRRRKFLLRAWREAVRKDASLSTGNALPRAQLTDHVPLTLAAFEQQLQQSAAGTRPSASDAVLDAASAHGVHRWQQGYYLREVICELGHLNAIMVRELDAYAMKHSNAAAKGMATARHLWAVKCANDIEESTTQFLRLQRMEAAGQVRDLEDALKEVNENERQRAELWEQLAHDLRGNVGVVATATRALTLGEMREASSGRFVQMLERNVESLRHLLDDMTSLARLQAGKEQRNLSELDVSALVTQLCDGLRALARQRGLYLRCSTAPEPLIVQGDGVKVRRLLQNLIINALKYTTEGGVDVSCTLADPAHGKRWVLAVKDTGPGIHAGPGSPLVVALKEATALVQDAQAAADAESGAPVAAGRAYGARTSAPSVDPRPVHQGQGEGIGLSIVKRLAQLLDATVEVKSEPESGTTFRVLLPIAYEE